MSHFSVHVFTAEQPSEEDLNIALAPYDENLEVAPYLSEFVTDQQAVKMRDEHYPDESIESALNKSYGGPPRREEAKSGWAIMTTRNPKSKWDWWMIGGRFAGSLCIGGDSGVSDSPVASLNWVDLVAQAATQANANYDLFEQATAGLTIPPSSREGSTPEELSVDPWVQAATAAVPYNGFLRQWPHYEFHVAADDPRGEYVADNASPDVPFAWVDLDGVWHERATMGWFGTTFDEKPVRAFVDEYRAYRDSLSAGAHVTVIDCHI